MAALIPFRDQVSDKTSEKIGKTFVFLDGRREQCRARECNFGNLLADAIVHIVSSH